MHGQNREEQQQKGDRALQLFEQGLKCPQIAERLGISRTHVAGMLQRARERRAAKQVAE